MASVFAHFCDVNHKLALLLQADEIDHEKILGLVEQREGLLQSLLDEIKHHPERARRSEWQDAINETAALVKLMQSKTEQISDTLRRYRHGNLSVQKYKQFL